jgi:hypothetical protein
MKKIAGILAFVCLVLTSTALFGQNMQNTKHYRSHFVYMTTGGFNSGVGTLHYGNSKMQNKIPMFSVNQMIGYQFNPYVSLGVELGLDVWKHTAFIPVAANLTVEFMDRVATPLWYMNAGYAFKWYVSSKPEKMTHVIHGAKPGLHLNTGIGAKVQIKEKLHLFIAADYKVQHTTLQYSVVNPGDLYDYSSITTNRTDKKFYHFIGLRIGFMYW